MDAKSHLLSLGWLGPGHALNSHLTSHKGRGGLGLTKPLLVSRKKNAFGVGRKSHEPASGNDWWLKGFEKALQGVGPDGSKSASATTSGTATPNTTGSAGGYRGKHQGLYGFFVKGEKLEGTIREEPVVTPAKEKRRIKKRKSDALDSPPTKDSTDPSDPRRVSKKARSGEMDHFTQASAYILSRDHGLRGRPRPQKESAFIQFQQISVFMGERDDADPALSKQKKRRNERKQSAAAKSMETGFDEEEVDVEELARSERKRQRREEKRLKKLLDYEGGTNPNSSHHQSGQWSNLLNSLTTTFMNDATKNSVDSTPATSAREVDLESLRRRQRKEERRLRRQEKEELRVLEQEVATQLRERQQRERVQMDRK